MGAHHLWIYLGNHLWIYLRNHLRIYLWNHLRIYLWDHLCNHLRIRLYIIQWRWLIQHLIYIRQIYSILIINSLSIKVGDGLQVRINIFNFTEIFLLIRNTGFLLQLFE